MIEPVSFVVDTAGMILSKVISLPFNLWAAVPLPIKLIIYTGMVALMILIIGLIIKTRKEIYRII